MFWIIKSQPFLLKVANEMFPFKTWWIKSRLVLVPIPLWRWVNRKKKHRKEKKQPRLLLFRFVYRKWVCWVILCVRKIQGEMSLKLLVYCLLINTNAISSLSLHLSVGCELPLINLESTISLQYQRLWASLSFCPLALASFRSL